MTTVMVMVAWKDVDAWNNTRDQVDDIIREATGTDPDLYLQTQHPLAKTGMELEQDAIDKLNALDGVDVVIPDSD